MMYAETVLEIWIDLCIGILFVFFAVQGLRRVFRDGSGKTELKMLTAVEAEKLKMKQKNGRMAVNGGEAAKEAGKEP